MTKNQKIALGCGGAGCLGLIFVVVVGCVIYFFIRRAPGRTHNFNVSTSRNSNSNADSNSDSNENSNTSSASSSSMSDDEKHRLYEAARMTGDTELIRRVSIKLGLMNEDFSPGDEYVGFVKDHVLWALRNSDFIQSLNTKEKAVAYVNEHFPE